MATPAVSKGLLRSKILTCVITSSLGVESWGSTSQMSIETVMVDSAPEVGNGMGNGEVPAAKISASLQ